LGKINSLIICILLNIILFAGCASYSQKTEDVLIHFSSGEQKEALEKLEEIKTKSSELLYLLEKGTILHYAGEFEESNKSFENAEALSDELYTKSISKEAGALLTSDNILPYSGERFELAFINFYRALNYVYLRRPEDALVECRKVNALLQRFSDKESGKSVYTNDAFIQYLTGILYEWQGELNDAFVSYRQAEIAYQNYEKNFWVHPPSQLKDALLRLSDKLGFTEEYKRYRQKYGKEREYRNPGWGELILIYENGFVPKKVEKNLVIPILKDEKIDEDTDIRKYSERLSKRARQNVNVSDVKIEYLLRIAIPTYTSSRPIIDHLEINVDGQKATSELVEDIEAIAQQTFAEHQDRILFKTTARALMKYIAFKTAEKKNQTAGLLVNLVNVTTERADTRSWLTLPNNIQMVQLPLPAGVYDLELTFFDSYGRQVSKKNIFDVVIRQDNYTFLNYRSFH